jgi:hypothetical protein
MRGFLFGHVFFSTACACDKTKGPCKPSVRRRDKPINDRIYAPLRDCAPFLRDSMFSGSEGPK